MIRTGQPYPDVTDVDMTYADVTERLFRRFDAVHSLPVITAVLRPVSQRARLRTARGAAGAVGTVGDPAPDRSAAHPLTSPDLGVGCSRGKICVAGRTAHP
jgi:hypothetical protein